MREETLEFRRSFLLTLAIIRIIVEEEFPHKVAGSFILFVNSPLLLVIVQFTPFFPLQEIQMDLSVIVTK
jgi:hypothetical protein